MSVHVIGVKRLNSLIKVAFFYVLLDFSWNFLEVLKRRVKAFLWCWCEEAEFSKGSWDSEEEGVGRRLPLLGGGGTD